MSCPGDAQKVGLGDKIKFTLSLDDLFALNSMGYRNTVIVVRYEATKFEWIRRIEFETCRL